MMIMITPESDGNKGVLLVGVIWVAAIISAAVVAMLQGALDLTVLPFFIAAVIPALLGIALYPVIEREWAQITVIFAWIALAIAATLSIAFVPMALLFLCAPAAAALFCKEKVIEAMVLSAIAAGLVYYANRFGFTSRWELPESLAQWSRTTAPAATIVFMIGAMFAAANSREAQSATADHDMSIIQSFPGAVLVADEEGAINFASDKAHALLGTNPRSVIGLALPNILTNSEFADERIAHIIDEVQVTGEPQSLDLTAVIMENDVETRRELRLDISPSTGSGVYAYISDISQSDEAVAQLLQQQVDAEQEAEGKALFFAGVSHELRTPLNAIIGFSDMMRSRLFGPLPGKYGEYADLIHDSGQHMLDLIGDVLDVSKIDAGKYELTYDSFDVGDVVRSSAKMIRPSADAAELTLDVEINDELPIMLDADRRAVRQVLLNLLSNAVKFTPKGGRVVASAMQIGDNVNITIEDNGAGMSEDELGRIGEPYVQGQSAAMSSVRGSGLGLSLVKSLVDLHGGSFAASSTPGQGTVISIDLPARRAL